MVLFCYLDDSGSDAEAPIISVAGYIAPTEAWERFEERAEPIFKAAGIECLHAKDMNATKGEFKGWSLARKQQFVSALYNCFSRGEHLGVGFSVTKRNYLAAKKRDAANHQMSAYGFALEALYNLLINHERFGPMIKEDGASIFVEAGHPNEGDATRNYHALCKKYPDEFPKYFRQFSFIPKSACRAVQMADFFAFNFRRHSAKVTPEDQKPLWPPLIAPVIRKCEHYGVVSFNYYRNPAAF